jgi:hypothetical protein
MNNNIEEKSIKSDIRIRANKRNRERKLSKLLKLALLVVLLILVLSYCIVSLFYNNGNFSITLDRNLYMENKIIIYDDPDYKVFRSELYAASVNYFDNISYKWLPEDIDKYDGSHNGENYVAYSFYIENTGEDVSDFWSEIVIDDVIKNVDEAVRIRVYKNGEYETYGKLGANGQPEKNTIPFESDTLVKMDHVQNFKPGDKIKYTIVFWLEGSDPECTDNILGGEIKMHMHFNSEFVEK